MENRSREAFSPSLLSSIAILTSRLTMSSQQTSLIERIIDSTKSSTSVQVGIATACCVGAAAAWVLSPYLTVAVSAAKGELLSLFVGTPEQRLLDHVKQTATKGDPKSVLDAIDVWCWKQQWMMHIGNRKGQILDQAVKDANPKLVVELGGYCGYSSIRIASNLKPGAKVYTIEASAKFAAIARQMIEFAGLSDVCTIFVGKSSDLLPSLPQLINGGDNATTSTPIADTSASSSNFNVDLFFIDHVKWAYLRDLKLIESLNYLRKGSVLVADNVIFPGAPDYLKHIRQNDKTYKSTFHPSTVEYSEIPDGVEVSIVL